jgi:hypothetical protein
VSRSIIAAGGVKTYLVITMMFLALAATTVSGASIIPFTGGDPGEGIDLSGSVVYAVNVTGTDAPDLTIQGVTFKPDAVVDGVSVVSGTHREWDTPSVYGDTANDDALEELMYTILFTINGNITANLDVENGKMYMLQLLFSENFYDGTTVKYGNTRRYFNVDVEGSRIETNFDPLQGETWTNNPDTGYVIRNILTATDDQLNVVLSPGSGGDGNPILNAFILTEVQVPEPTTGILLVVGGLAIFLRRRA